MCSDSATFEFAPAASALRRMLQQYTYVCTLSVYNGREYLTYEGLQTCTSPVVGSCLILPTLRPFMLVQAAVCHQRNFRLNRRARALLASMQLQHRQLPH